MNNDTRKLLNNIYSTLQESQAGYRECAENVKDRAIKEKFVALSAKHQQMIDALEEEAALLGEKVENTDTLLGKAHQFFTGIKSLISQEDLLSLVKDIEREEDHLISDYKNVLKQTLPFDLEILLKYQSNEIEKDFREIKKFQSTYQRDQKMANIG